MRSRAAYVVLRKPRSANRKLHAHAVSVFLFLFLFLFDPCLLLAGRLCPGMSEAIVPMSTSTSTSASPDLYGRQGREHGKMAWFVADMTDLAEAGWAGMNCMYVHCRRRCISSLSRVAFHALLGCA